MLLSQVREFDRKRRQDLLAWTWMGLLFLLEMLGRAAWEGSRVTGALPLLTYSLLSPLLSAYWLAFLSFWPWMWTGRADDLPSWRRGLAQGLLAGIAAFVGFIVIDALIVPTLYPQPIHGGGFLLLVFRMATANAVISCLIGWSTVSMAREALARLESERRLKDAEWILLKGQLAPHAFFNGMTALTEMIRKDPARAEGVALDLADLFRRLMTHGLQPLSTLGHERELVERYLAIETLRLGSRLQVLWDWAPDLDGVMAPPFLLQPLVENALKHGIGPRASGGTLTISSRCLGDLVELRVTNPGEFTPSTTGTGTGLANLRARLALAFQDHGTCSLASAEGLVTAQVRFPVMKEGT